MKLSDIATALEASEPTIKRDMRMAKAWLRVENRPRLLGPQASSLPMTTNVC
jgi:hypothetical protein